MHIKTIALQGFKSYRDQGPISEGEEGKEFSAQANLVVGKNGSGKSNFFSALQFVLGQGDRFQRIAPEHRRELLHEGTGRSVLSAYVEIVFDNTDQRLVVHGDRTDGKGEFDNRVVIRRTVGLKKDEYRVNNKAYSASEVQNLLETAGLSSQNPYNVVQQGRVAEFAMMSDERRFQVIKDVAGTQLYETRRDQASTLLERTVHDMEQIQNHLGDLDAKLKDVSEEREEFKVYQGLERQRRALQYCYYKHESEEAKGKLDAINANTEQDTRDAATSNLKLDSKDKKASEIVELVERLAARAADAEVRRGRILKEFKEVGKRHAAAKTALELARQATKESTAKEEQISKGLRDVGARVQEEEKKLAKFEERVSKAQEDLDKATSDLRAKERRSQQLLAKRKRKDQFATRADRDKYLSSEVKKLDASVETSRKDIERLKGEIKKATASIQAAQKQRKEREGEMASKKKQFEPLRQQAKVAISERDRLADERRLLHRKQNEMQRELDETQEKRRSCESRVRRTMPASIRQAHDNVKHITSAHGIQGVYGPVLNLFKVPPELATACDVVAGNQLFHIVVESSETVQKILDVFNKEGREGRPSFFPLNRLNAVRKELPTHGDTCFPLYDKVVPTHPHYEKVMADLFGRVLVCNTLATASEYSRSHNCDCVTPQGDRVDRRGGISGGWRGHDVSRCEAQADADKYADAAEKIEGDLKQVKDEGAKLEAKMAEVGTKVRKAELAVDEGQRWAERAGIDQQGEEARISDLQVQLTASARQISLLQESVKDAEAQRATFKQEMGTEMVSELTRDETKELAELQGSLAKCREDVADKGRVCSEAQSALNRSTEALRSNLRRREADLRADANTLAVDGTADAQRRAEHSEKELRVRADALDAELKELDREVERHSTGRKKAQEELEDVRNETASARKKLEEEKSKRSLMEEDRKFWSQRKDESLEKIRKLGVLPESKQFEALTTRKLLEEMNKVNHEIKKYSHVNKKAADQFINLQEQTTKLHEQFDSRTEERGKLEALISHLDEQKDSTVLRTFKQIKLHFQSKFAKLVGHDGARGELVLKRKTGDKRRSRGGATVDEFRSVQVRVNFGVGGDVGGDEGDQDMSRLSGGQKSVVALALIFAIQAADPAPFYIFDEVDAALDAEYRTNVASMVEAQSRNAQFLIASFKPEMVGICQRHFAIGFQNKVSRITRCAPETALRLLRAAEMDDQRGDAESRKGGRSVSTLHDSTTADSETTAVASVSPSRKRARRSVASAP